MAVITPPCRCSSPLVFIVYLLSCCEPTTNSKRAQRTSLNAIARVARVGAKAAHVAGATVANDVTAAAGAPEYRVEGRLASWWQYLVGALGGGHGVPPIR